MTVKTKLTGRLTNGGVTNNDYKDNIDDCSDDNSKNSMMIIKNNKNNHYNDNDNNIENISNWYKINHNKINIKQNSDMEGAIVISNNTNFDYYDAMMIMIDVVNDGELLRISTV